MRNAVLLVLGLLAGCAVAPQVANDAARPAPVAREAQSDIAPPNPPSSVREALLPPLRVDVPLPGRMDDPEPRFDLSADNAPVQRVFQSVVSGTRYSIVIPPTVSGYVSVNFKGVSVREALEAIREVYGYEFRIEGLRIFIAQSASLQTRIFKLPHSSERPNGAQGDQRPYHASGGMGAVHGNAQGHMDGIPKPGDFWGGLTASLRALVGGKEGRNVVVNPQSGVIAVRAMPDELRAVEAYLKVIRPSGDQGTAR